QINIVTVYHIGISDSGLPFIAMELIDGVSLRKILSANSPMLPLRALNIVKKVAEALVLVHQKGIVHRDLKPENIILLDKPEPDTPKLVDFGLARLQQEQKLTNTGILIGTASYMSPEQCAGRVADSRSDIYSLLVVLYELLHGKTPYSADNPVGLMYKHMHEPLPELDLRVDAVSARFLNELFQKGLAKEPDDRYQNMKELQDDLEKIEVSLEHGGLQPRSRSRMPRKYVSIAGFLLLVFGLLVFFAFMDNMAFRAKILGPNSAEDHSGFSKQDLSFLKSGKRITISSALLICNASREIEEKNPDRAIVYLDKYLAEGKLDSRARCILLNRRGKLEKDLIKRLAFLKKSYEISGAIFEREKSANEFALHMYLAGSYVLCLRDSKRWQEVEEVAARMAEFSDKYDFDSSRPIFTAELGEYLGSDFLAFEADAALELGDKKRAARILDKLVATGYGGFRKAQLVARALLRLGRFDDLAKFISDFGLSYAVDGSDVLFYNYDASMNFEALLEIASECAGYSQFKLAEEAIDQADLIDTRVYENAHRRKYLNRSVFMRPTSGVLQVTFARASVRLSKGDVDSARSLIRNLDRDWIASNDDSAKVKVARLMNVNPLPLVLRLFKDGENSLADQILVIVSKSIPRYTDDLSLPFDGENGNFEYNRKRLIAFLKPYESKDPAVAEFLTKMAEMKSPTALRP
ncbi:MAG: serine/threonine protein kinase, partial [Candidatus Obscuribacterales bacterium]|nr:serine/threonine protein kinase [Candidatus Obscuribacterales bacterium]